MKGTYQLVVASALLAILTGACSQETTNPYDRAQQKINEEAYRNRFHREAVPDEITGIKISPEESRENFANPNWKVILATGDDSIRAFDNARKRLFQLFSMSGIDEAIQLSRNPMEQVGGVRPMSAQGIQQAAYDLKIKDGDGCLLFMTSHGSPQGFYIKGQMPFTPSQVNGILNATCGRRPTVLLISACYSGIFAEPMMEAPNRIILTAARKDKTSFGCSAEAQYTYWDGCLIDNLPLSKTYLELAQRIEQCIDKKESMLGFARSYPQARFGADMKTMEIKQ